MPKRLSQVQRYNKRRFVLVENATTETFCSLRAEGRSLPIKGADRCIESPSQM